MTCHSFYCFSIVWSQGNAPLVTSLPNSGYICSEVVGGVMANVLVRSSPPTSVKALGFYVNLVSY